MLVPVSAFAYSAYQLVPSIDVFRTDVYVEIGLLLIPISETSMLKYPSKPILSTFKASNISCVKFGLETIKIALLASHFLFLVLRATSSIILSPFTSFAVKRPSLDIVA